MKESMRTSWIAIALITTFAGAVSGIGFAAEEVCPGDCNGDWSVSIDELIRGVNMALGRTDSDDCPAFDASGDHRAAVDELLAGVRSTLAGCPQRQAFIIATNFP